jgi:hypothetical protein
MIRFGPLAREMKNMSSEDIFSSRLKLLIIMTKAYLKDCPIGEYRKQAIIENARSVFYQSLKLSSELSAITNDDSRTQSGKDSSGDMNDAYIFHQRTQLLAVMAQALAEGRLKGSFRKKALQDNVNSICKTLIFNFHIKDVNFLKVA